VVEDRPQVLLASRSPRRRELLGQLGLRFRVTDPEVDEAPLPGEAPDQYVRRVARDKARAGAAAAAGEGPALPALGADTCVLLDGRVLGKPTDPEEALDMLTRLSGRSHLVLSGVAVAADGRLADALSRSAVQFRPLSAAECRAYVAHGEPLDKAGAYAIQGLGAMFVAHLEGSYSGVMGLPLFETARLLTGFGIHPLAGP
jgi:septum formation protein